jgi:hypothetical protein
MHAKVNGISLLKYPYSLSDLMDENRFTRYDNRYSLIEWYSKTSEAVENNYRLVEVIIANPPEHNSDTHYIVQRATPELIDSTWTLRWDIIEIIEQPGSLSEELDPPAGGV